MKNRYAPVKSFENLKKRIDRFFETPLKRPKQSPQISLDLFADTNHEIESLRSYLGVTDFINFLSDAAPNGDLYLFGGILRDMALFGRKGFNSDIDIVVEGDWVSCENYLKFKGARKNKFGGYRLYIEDWPIDIWNAEKTWAIAQGLIEYKGVSSLTNTTIINWDAILMNWRTKNFICRDGYLESLKERKLDIVLESNPNPIGMAVRVFRHIGMKEPNQITPKAMDYLARSTANYSFAELRTNEIRSYKNTVIEYAHYRWFELLMSAEKLEFSDRLHIATESLKSEGITLSGKQEDYISSMDSIYAGIGL